tara:strand:+ start:2711 stop:3040 length:330 start_codon:yes stop_codon:yes gene_type:complete
MNWISLFMGARNPLANAKILNTIDNQNNIFTPLAIIIGSNIRSTPINSSNRAGGPPSLTVIVSDGNKNSIPKNTHSNPAACENINPVWRLLISFPVKNLNNINDLFLIF